MLNGIKSLFNNGLSKMKNFDLENKKAKTEIEKHNISFNEDLSSKIHLSSDRITTIRNSIQNTKL